METSHRQVHVVDVKQLALWPALASLGTAFWILGGMELIERLAYFGVKIVRVLYASTPRADGGLGVDLSEFGVILAVWAFVQTSVPIVSGGISDRVGLKKVLAYATACKIISYLLMAYFPTYWGFMWGAVLLAFGTGIFKPAVQGSVVKVTGRLNSSVAWGVFYQIVNIGAFLGPLVAAYMRQIEWRLLFLSCAGIIALNFLLLATYREPPRVARDGGQGGESRPTEKALWRDALTELAKPELLAYLLLFSGFWFMFLALFDVLPIFIRDWVDTRPLVGALFGPGGTGNPVVIFLLGMANTGDSFRPEGILNLNSAMIMSICFLVAGASARMRAMRSITLGISLCAAAMFLIGAQNGALACVVGIAIFSIGEMLSSPKFLEFLGNLAPPGKTAMYLGFSALPQGIAATLEGYLGPHWYNLWFSKDTLARHALLASDVDSGTVRDIPVGEAFQFLLQTTQQSADAATHALYTQHDVGMVWYLFGFIGILSAIGLAFYGRWIARVMRSELSK